MFEWNPNERNSSGDRPEEPKIPEILPTININEEKLNSTVSNHVEEATVSMWSYASPTVSIDEDHLSNEQKNPLAAEPTMWSYSPPMVEIVEDIPVSESAGSIPASPTPLGGNTAPQTNSLSTASRTSYAPVAEEKLEKVASSRVEPPFADSTVQSVEEIKVPSTNPFMTTNNISYAPISEEQTKKTNDTAKIVENSSTESTIKEAPPIPSQIPVENPVEYTDILAGPTSFPYGANTPPTPYGPVAPLGEPAPLDENMYGQMAYPPIQSTPPSFGTPAPGYGQQPTPQGYPTPQNVGVVPAGYGGYPQQPYPPQTTPYPQPQQQAPPAFGTAPMGYGYSQPPVQTQQSYPQMYPAPQGYQQMPQQMQSYPSPQNYGVPPTGYAAQPFQPIGYAAPVPVKKEGKSKVVAAILCLLGGFGVHRFYLGYIKRGILYTVMTIVALILTWIPNWIYTFKNSYQGYGVTKASNDATAYNFFYYIGAAILVVVAVLVIIDFVKILQGKLKTAKGEDLY